jgi:hypothetical protein
MRLTIYIFLILFCFGCGESLPSQDAKDKSVKASYKKDSQKAAVETESDKKETQKNASSSTTKEKKGATGGKNSVDAQKESPLATGVASQSAIESVMNYGTGKTQLTIKKKMEEKIKNIQDEHNKKVEQSIREY